MPKDSEDLEPVNGDVEESDGGQHLDMCAYAERVKYLGEKKSK